MQPPRDEAWIAPGRPDLVWFRGEDAVRFLNDILSQEISDMEPGDVRRSMLLTPEGKIDHLLWVVVTEEGIGLITDEGRGDDLARSLRRYKIRVDVEISAESRDRWLVMGRRDGIDISWVGVVRTLVIGDRPDLPERAEGEYEAIRIAAGEPVWGRDVDISTIPQESGLVDVAVDFEKGCFVGQELVGRIEARGGSAPRPLRIVELDGPAAPGDTITHGGNDVGLLTSVAGGLGLGVLKRRVEPGQSVEVGGVEGIVREIPSKPKT